MQELLALASHPVNSMVPLLETQLFLVKLLRQLVVHTTQVIGHMTSRDVDCIILTFIPG